MTSTEIPTGMLYNGCYGGFRLSQECIKAYTKKTGKYIDKRGIECRRDPDLIALYSQKGSKWMSTNASKIKLFEVPQEMLKYVYVSEYDGMENAYISFTSGRKEAMISFLNVVKENESNLKKEYRKLKKALNDIDTLRKKYSDL